MQFPVIIQAELTNKIYISKTLIEINQGETRCGKFDWKSLTMLRDLFEPLLQNLEFYRKRSYALSFSRGDFRHLFDKCFYYVNNRLTTNFFWFRLCLLADNRFWCKYIRILFKKTTNRVKTRVNFEFIRNILSSMVNTILNKVIDSMMQIKRIWL